MKLLMITGLGSAKDLASGKRGAFYNTLEEFHKYWERIDIISPKIAGGDEIKNLFGNVYVHISSWPLILHPIWFLKKGNKIYKEHKFDLMTVHEFPPFYNGIGARLLWNKIRVPYVLEIHHIPGYPRAFGTKESVYKFFTYIFAKYDSTKAKAVRVVNQHQAPEFLKKAGVPVEKIKYMPSAYIDLEIFKPKSDVEKKYDLVCAARLEKNKGIGLLIEAIKIVKLQNPNIKLLIVGSGPELENYKLQITNYKLQNNVFFSGWLETSDDVARAYNSAKIFVNTSYNEGGPRTVLEAMACGLPVITTRVGLMPDIIKNGENGFFTDWNPHSIADKITHLLHSDNLQKQFFSVGLELVKQFEKKSAIKNYAETLQGLIKKLE